MIKLFTIISLLFFFSSETFCAGIVSNDSWRKDSANVPSGNDSTQLKINHKKLPAFVGINLGLVFSNQDPYMPKGSPGTGWYFDVSVSRITAVIRKFTGSGSTPEATESAVMFGLNYRNNSFIADIVCGYGAASFECTNESNLTCSVVKEGSAAGFAMQEEFCLIASKGFGIGLSAFQNWNRFRNFYGIMFNLKFGVLRSLSLHAKKPKRHH
jgi:hypothetical protein